MINEITKAITAVLNWIGMILEAAIDWGWSEPSEGIILIAGLMIIGIIIGKKIRRR